MEQRGEFASNSARSALPLAILYLVALVLALLYPFDFSSPFTSRENSVRWAGKREGVAFGPSGILLGAEPPASLYKSLVTGKGLTVELWLRTASTDQQGPARIISCSLDPWQRNFTLGQAGNALVFRLRTAGTDTNGMPSFDVADVFVSGTLQHVVVTYDFREKRLYVDGRLRAASSRASGSLDGWDPSYVLVFGNEASGARAWNGSILFAAIYDRALSTADIADRHESGPRDDLRTPPHPILAYDFTRGLNLQDEQSQARSDRVNPPLTRPARVAAHSPHFSRYSGGRFLRLSLDAWDLAGNVILFVPFGVLGFLLARRRVRSGTIAVLTTVAAASVFSATCEALQFFESARTSSVLDLATNAGGALAGAAGCRLWMSHIGPQRQP